MTAYGDDPKVHRIEVEFGIEDGERVPTHVRFVCDAGRDAPCHHYPNCECEVWSAGDHFEEEWDSAHPDKQRTPRPGHENVQQEKCWIDPWFNDAIGNDPDEWVEAYDGDDDLSHLDLRSGPISVTFEEDYMTWEYA